MLYVINTPKKYTLKNILSKSMKFQKQNEYPISSVLPYFIADDIKIQKGKMNTEGQITS